MMPLFRHQSMEFLQPHSLKLAALTPVHLGTGEELDPIQAPVSDNEAAFFELDLSQLAELLTPEQHQALNQLTQQSGADSLQQIYLWLKANLSSLKPAALHLLPAAPELAQKVRQDLGKTSQRENKRRIFNQFHLMRCQRHLWQGTPVIPGSSIKGALRTAILNQLNQGRFHKNFRNSNRQMEQELLAYQKIPDDPLRLLGVVDACWQPPLEAGPPVYLGWAHNMRRRPKPEQAKTGAPSLMLEVLPISPFNLKSQIRFKAAQQSTQGQNTFDPRFNDWQKLAQICNSFYWQQLKETLHDLQQLNALPPAWVKQLQALLQGELGEALNLGQVMLLRLGRFSGAESNTLEGTRQIKLQKNPKPASAATTRWIFSGQKNPVQGLPLGFVLLAPNELQLPETQAWLSQQHQQLVPNWSDLLGNLRQEQARIVEIKQRAEARAAELAQQQAEEAKEAERKASLTPEQQLLEAIQQGFEEAQRFDLREPTGPLRQQLNQLADALSQLSLEEKQQALLLAQELFLWWQVNTKKNKKAKTLLQRFKQEIA